MKQPAKIAILNSVISIVLCLVLMVNATMALFTSESAVNIAVTSGSVNVVATPSLESASSAEWNDISGRYEDESLDTAGNRATFANGGTVSIDGGKVELDRIMPGDSATIKIEIKNLSSIDIKYQLTATFGEGDALLNALGIELTCDENGDLDIFDSQFTHTATGSNPDKLSKWQTLSADSVDPENPTVATLHLKISFPMDLTLETATLAGQSANITLAVNAVQGNAHTEDPKEPEAEPVGPDHAKVTVRSSEEGMYKILEAVDEPGHEFLYWAFKAESGVSKTARASVATEFGVYLTNNRIYKFRVTSETYGTYQAVYRATGNNSKVVRLNKASSAYQVVEEDVGTNITLIAEEEVWDIFDHFVRTKDGEASEDIQGDDKSTYTLTVGSEDLGATYTAQYSEFTLEDYENLFDNTGAINYEAEIIDKNVPRQIPQDFGCGGIDGVFTEGEFKGAGTEYEDQLVQPEDYPIYGKGYEKFPNKSQFTSTAAYKKNNKLVFDETKALAEVGNYFMDEAGILWVFGPEGTDTSAYFANLYEEFFKEYGDVGKPYAGQFDQALDENGNFSATLFEAWTNNLYDADEKPAWYDIYYQEVYLGGWEKLFDWHTVGHLYKHYESRNMYLGDVSNEEHAVEKRISATARGTTQGWSPTITGLYAPAGEVITFKMSREDMARTGGMILTIGMVQMPGLPLIFGEEKYPSRPARITAQTTITPNTKHPDTVQFFDETTGEYTFYFGSYLGGPIYVSPVNPGTSFTIDIKGAVEYQHYIYGVTTEKEFEARKDTSAPYFECWVASEDVRFVGPYSQVKTFTFENYVKVSRLWENAARISKRFPSQSNSEYGIMVMFETYVQSGAACAFAGANTVDSPYGWMGGALSYESIVEYGGWGNFHEFNHCYQYFGIGADSEVSNNTVNLVEYALLTEISAHRDVDENGISTRYTGWESYTDPAFALRVLTGGNPSNGSRDKNLCRYVNLFYAFGLERYIEMTQITSHNGGQIWGSSKGSYPFFKGACEGSGYNMEYYFNEILFPESDDAYKKYHINLEDSYVKNDYDTKYSQSPMFVPVACTYQTGVGYAFDPKTGNGVNARTRTGNVQWEYTTTSRPFRIDFSKSSFTIDFEKTLAIPGRIKNENGNGWIDTQFFWTIECTEDPAYGTVRDIDGGRNFTYIIDEAAKAARTSGRMVFTVEYNGVKDTVAAGIQGRMQIVVQFDAKPGSIREYEHLDRTTYTFAEGIEENKDSESGEGSEGVAAVAETKSPFEMECEQWIADLQGSGKMFDGTFGGALYVTTEPNVLPTDKAGENNTAVYFDDELHPAPADSFVVISGIYTPANNGTYYLGIESGHKAAALYLSTDGKTYSLFVTASKNSGGLYQDGSAEPNSVYRAAKTYTFTANKPVYFREVLAIDPEASDNHIKMIWGGVDCSTVNQLSDQLQNASASDHAGCAYCVKDESTSYELEYLETRDQYFLEKTTATQEMVDVKDGGGLKIIEESLPGFVTPKKENFFDENLYNPFRVDGSSGTLTIIGRMSESVTADFFTIRTDADNAPLSYQLFVGNDKANINTLVFEQNWSKYGERPRLQRLGTLEHPFNGGEQTFQYYKLVVTQASGRLILYGIEFGNRWNVKQPSDRDVEKLGAWEDVRTHGSTFGYLLTAKGKGETEKEPFSSLTMKFTGKELHIRALTGQEFGAVELLIDGKSIADIDLRNSETKWADILSDEFLSEETLAKISDALESGGEHTLVLRSVERFNVDAVYYR